MADRLPKAAADLISSQIDDLIDRAKKRFLGPQSVPKRLYVGYQRDLSLPGIFANAVAEEGGVPDLEQLAQLLEMAGNYLDAARLRAKSKILNSVRAFVAENETEDWQAKLSTELSQLFGELKYEVRRIVDTESQKVRNIGQLEGIVRVNASLGVKEPVVFFVIVRDGDACAECKRLHMLEDGKTPRVWHLFEIGHGHHKRGDENPKVDGLHPSCRCSLTTLVPGFGFSESGYVTWKGEGHDEFARQRGLPVGEESEGEG